MLYLLIGHRGAGKTSFLKRVQFYFGQASRPVQVWDLDEEIVKRSGKSVALIFEQEGEPSFRAWEEKVFKQLFEARKGDAYIAIGAGFEFELPSEECRVLWIRRMTDSLPRIFLDRPRLDASVSPAEEYLQRFEKREARYAALATDVWMIPEGFEKPNAFEKDFVLGTMPEIPGTLTVLPEHFRRGLNLPASQLYEVRDDLLDSEQIAQALMILPAEKTLYSIRKGTKPPEGVLTDLAMEFPSQSVAYSHMVSCHERRGTISETARALEEAGKKMNARFLKLAPVVQNFSELWEGHQWAFQDFEHRAFLPRSAPEQEGRWRWYRLLEFGTQPLSFYRLGQGSSPDQPYLFEVLKLQPQSDFAAVLGYPIDHSRTPSEQFEFFYQRGVGVLAIPVPEAECEDALRVLQHLGMKYAAVTAPLKTQVAKLCKNEGSVEDSVNSLYWSKQEECWVGTNTDLEGLRWLPEDVKNASTVVWGGGGTLPVLKNSLPGASFYSAQTGQPREGQAAPAESPRAVIWCVGRTRGGAMPPRDWHPQVVVDLNYSEDSPGRELALRSGAKYVSGAVMFEAQAKAQREFWGEQEKVDVR
ncbi:hypothetical protein K2X30_06900 [bacterium]|nr:hypothetical protein [bacterium]